LLAIDTSTHYAGVGVLAGTRIWERTWRSGNNHGIEILAATEEALKQAGSSLAAVDAIGVAIGPGGFSALRVGIATAKGIAVPRALPLVGISTFEIEAARWWSRPGPLVAVIDAGSAGLYWALYEDRSAGALPGPALRRSYGVAAVDRLASLVPEDAAFCGEVDRLRGVVDTDRILSSDGPASADASSDGSYASSTPRRPADLLRLADARLRAGDVDDPSRLVPLYVRQPSITRPRDPASRPG
jgi:tRNA threonylcarbamoyladenosine biosynthesis protein TsaB